MFEYLISNKATVEIIYLLSAPIMLIGLLIGLFQLYLIKKDFEVKYKREAIRDTLNIFQNKINTLENLWVELGTATVEEELKAYTNTIVGFSIDSFSKNDKWLIDFKNTFLTYNKSVDLLNELEQLAQFIQSGLADEKLAYSLQGQYFVKSVDRLKHYIAAHRDSEHMQSYSEIISLYTKWSRIIEHEKLMVLHKETAEKIDKIPKKAPNKPIGV